MSLKQLAVYGVILIAIQFLVSAHLFVTYAEMTDYAASKDALKQVMSQLDRIEHKLDKIIMGY